MKTLIFSDVHLKVTPETAQERKEFVAFLRQIDGAQYERVIILGDLFDFWFEYRHVIFSGYFEVLRAFSEMREAGIELHLVCGNHDFWAGRFLEEELGFSIHSHDYRSSFGGQRAMFVHGDGQNPGDISYRIYKVIARSKPAIWLFGLLHPDWAMALAHAVSSLSRKLFQSAQGSEARSLHAFAERVLAEGETDVILCGHTHDPVIQEFSTPGGTGLYINTGDWMNHHSYVEWNGERFEMKTYDGPA